MIEIENNKYIFLPNYYCWEKGSIEKANKQLQYIETPKEFCNKIANANSDYPCYRVEDSYFNPNVNAKKEIFIPLCEEYNDLGKTYGFAWFRMTWGEVFIRAAGSSPNDSYYLSYGWYKLPHKKALRELLLKE